MITVISLFLGGIAIVAIELYFKCNFTFSKHLEGGRPDSFQVENGNKTNIKNLSYKKAFLIGIFQSISVIPGVSRAAATIFGGLFMGLDRKSAVEFSFILAIPTMLVATGYDLFKNANSFSNSDFQTLTIGFIASFIVALLTIKWLLQYVQSNTFIPFGIYRIILGLAFFLFVQ